MSEERRVQGRGFGRERGGGFLRRKLRGRGRPPVSALLESRGRPPVSALLESRGRPPVSALLESRGRPPVSALALGRVKCTVHVVDRRIRTRPNSAANADCRLP